MDPIISYRLTATGVWGYEFRQGDTPLGKVSCNVGPASVARIEGRGVSWYSTFNPDRDIVPGVSRRVRDSRTGEELFRLLYCEPGYYRMGNADSSLLVEKREGVYLFGDQGQPVLAVTERTEGETMRLPGKRDMDIRPWFRTTVYEEGIREDLLLAVLSFPALCFL